MASYKYTVPGSGKGYLTEVTDESDADNIHVRVSSPINDEHRSHLETLLDARYEGLHPSIPDTLIFAK